MLLYFVDCMWKILLALEVVGDILDCLEQFNTIAFKCHACEVAKSLNLLAHDIGILPSYQGKDGLDVFSHVHSALNLFINALIPDMPFPCSSSFRQVIWLWRLENHKVFNCQSCIATLSVCMRDIFRDLLHCLVKLICLF